MESIFTPVRPTLAITTTRSAYSTAADPWFNNAQVSVSITRGADYGGYQTGAYQIGYGTRTLGSTAKPGLTYTTGRTRRRAQRPRCRFSV